jgi:DNA-binding response OmpR family regulator
VTESLAFGNVELDYKNPSVKNRDTGESIATNNKEFQLLEYFMMNPNQVLSKDMIFDRVWGMDNEAISNNLEAYISFVRKKLKAIDATVSIKVIRNMGYKMELKNEGTK